MTIVAGHCIARIALVATTALIGHAATAERATVAVAANFYQAAQQIAAEFGSSSGHHVVLATGSTGLLFAQILNGAPYDLFLAADEERPRLLELRGSAVPGSRFTYAVGSLVLWSSDRGLLADAALELLASDRVRHIAIANPELAPYGAAARAVLEHAGIWSSLQRKLAVAQSVGQAYAMVATGNAEVGFVGQAQIVAEPGRGSMLQLDPGSYTPIRQDAVLLAHGAGNAAALGFAAYLRSPAARAVLETFGYSAP